MEEKKNYSIKELRDICQGRGPASVTQTFVGKTNRIFSIYLTKYLVKTKITPNQVTSLGTTIFLIGTVLYAFGEFELAVAGFILIVLNGILDACDGELYRLRGYTEGYGSSYVEPLSHDIMYGLMFLPISYGAFIATGEPLLLFTGAVAVAAKLLYRLLDMRFYFGVLKKLEEEKYGGTNKEIEFNRQSVLKRWMYIIYRHTATSTGLIIPLFLATVFWQLNLFVLFYAALYSLHLAETPSQQIYFLFRFFLERRAHSQ